MIFLLVMVFLMSVLSFLFFLIVSCKCFGVMRFIFSFLFAFSVSFNIFVVSYFKIAVVYTVVVVLICLLVVIFDFSCRWIFFIGNCII